MDTLVFYHLVLRNYEQIGYYKATMQPLLVDSQTRRDNIHRKTLEGIKDLFPIVGKQHTLELKSLSVKPKEYSFNQQKTALMQGRTLHEPVVGTLTLRDNKTGKVIDEKVNHTLLHLPYFTERHTFVVGGNEYDVPSQLRLKPGVYTRERGNGEFEAAFNLSKGDNFRISMEPESGKINMELGTTKVPLYPLLKAMGVPDADIRNFWGNDLKDVNANAFKGNLEPVLNKVIGKVRYDALDAPKTLEAKQAFISEYFNNTRMDPEVTQRTLGMPLDRANSTALLAASQKLIQVQKKEAEEDDRDSLEFKTIHSVDDFFRERLKLDAKRTIGRKLLNRINQPGQTKIETVVPNSTFTKSINSFLTTSALSSIPMQINPVEIIDHASRITSLGEGGISSDRAIPFESRKVHNTHFGILDPVRTSDGGNAGIDIRSTTQSFRDDAGNLYATVIDVKTKKKQQIPVTTLAKSTIAFPGQAHRKQVDAIQGKRTVSVPWSEVDYELPDATYMFGPSTSLVPLLDGMQGNRAIMGSKFQTQALPLVGREAPLVQAAAPLKGVSMEQELGLMAVPISKVNGIVTKVDKDYVYIRADGPKTASTDVLKVPYNTYFPLASKTYLHHDITVKEGDKVKKDQPLGTSNFTKDGAIALGKNLKVGYMAYYGKNSNDAVVISEGAAKKLTSEHMYKQVQTKGPEVIINKAKFVAYFGMQFTGEQLAKLDANGVAKEGSILHKGDPIILGMRKAPPSPEAQLLGNLHKSMVKPYKDITVTWEKLVPCEIQDVMDAPRQVMVTVRTLEPMKIGDKLSNRFGGKGVVSEIISDDTMVKDETGDAIDVLFTSAGIVSRCYDEKTEFLTDRGWVFGRDITPKDKFAAYDPTTDTAHFSKQKAEFYATEYAGELIQFEHAYLDLAVTPGHTVWSRPVESSKGWRETKIDALFGHSWILPTAAKFTDDKPATPFTLPHLVYSIKDTQSNKEDITIDADTWASFLGWFLSEGHCIPKEYKTFISQCKRVHPEHCADIEKVLNKLPFSWYYKNSVRGYVIHSKRLAVYCKQFGNCTQKHVPDWLFSQPYAVRQLFLDALWKGDGHTSKKGSRIHSKLGVTSSRLVDDVQRLFCLQGVPSIRRSVKVKSERHSSMWGCHVQLQKHDRHTNRSGWKKTYYEGRVYCPTVDTGYVFTRRNGKLLIAGNTNPNQVIEAALGKVAEKTGKPIILQQFQNEDNVQFAKKLMKQHGVKDKETVYDPISGRHIPNIFVGRSYIHKLFKSTETNYSARGVSDYDVNLQPTRGGDEGAKGIGKMEMNALLAHNARNVLKEALTIKSEKSDDFWRAYEFGLPPPPLKTPFVAEKFVSMLRGAGINVDKSGSQVSLGPLTDKDITGVSSGALSVPSLEKSKSFMVSAKNMKPESGGLFDPTLTGGLTGTRWSHMELAEPVVNPVFEDAARRMLDLTKTELNTEISNNGAAGIKTQLNKIDLAQREKELMAKSKTARGLDLDSTVKQLKHIQALRKSGFSKAGDAYVLSKIPVIPPVFRPILPSQRGNELQVSDINYLYRDLGLSSEALKGISELGLPEATGQARLNLHESTRALFGVAPPTSPQLKGRDVKGFIEQITGSGSPKGGFLHKKILKKQQDISGRATATPDNTLNMDQIGLPEDMIWKTYGKFVMRGLIGQGYTALKASEMVEEKHSAAKAVLDAELLKRPVFVNRAPSLHKHNFVAAYPVPVSGQSLRVNPFMEQGQNLDYDGDTMQIHVPIGDKAVAEAQNLVLSKLLFGDKNRDDLMVFPQHEAILGTYLATSKTEGGKPKKFKTKEEAMAAYNRGEITLKTPVEIGK